MDQQDDQMEAALRLGRRLGVAFLGLVGVVLVMGSFANWPARLAPRIVALELARGPATARAIVQGYERAGVSEKARLNTILDTVAFIPAYALNLWLGGWIAASVFANRTPSESGPERRPSPGWMLGAFAAWSAPVAGVLDEVENLGLFGWLGGGPLHWWGASEAWLWRLTFYPSVAKWGLAGASLLIGLAGLAGLTLRARKPRRAAP